MRLNLKGNKNRQTIAVVTLYEMVSCLVFFDPYANRQYLISSLTVCLDLWNISRENGRYSVHIKHSD